MTLSYKIPMIVFFLHKNEMFPSYQEVVTHRIIKSPNVGANSQERLRVSTTLLILHWGPQDLANPAKVKFLTYF